MYIQEMTLQQWIEAVEEYCTIECISIDAPKVFDTASNEQGE